MATLRDELTTFLEGWRSDLSPAWSDFFATVEPDFDAVPLDLLSDTAFPVIPGRRASPRPGAPAGAHVFRAFDGADPKDVSVVVIGQDPYPRVSRATGRAFEDGALKGWDGQVAVSLQRLMQSAVAQRYGRPDLATKPADWKRIQAGVGDGSITLEGLGTYFDRLQQAHGVLFVNAGWTLTKFVPGGGPEQKGHIAMWRPVMDRLLTGLAERDEGRVVYLLLGGFAQKLFDASGVEQRAKADGRWGVALQKVAHPHPNTIGPTGYLESGNPLARVNEALAAMSAPPVAW